MRKSHHLSWIKLGWLRVLSLPISYKDIFNHNKKGGGYFVGTRNLYKDIGQPLERLSVSTDGSHCLPAKRERVRQQRQADVSASSSEHNQQCERWCRRVFPHLSPRPEHINCPHHLPPNFHRSINLCDLIIGLRGNASFLLSLRLFFSRRLLHSAHPLLLSILWLRAKGKRKKRNLVKIMSLIITLCDFAEASLDLISSSWYAILAILCGSERYPRKPPFGQQHTSYIWFCAVLDGFLCLVL